MSQPKNRAAINLAFVFPCLSHATTPKPPSLLDSMPVNTPVQYSDDNNADVGMTAGLPSPEKGKHRLENSEAAAASLRKLSLEPQMNGAESSRAANGARRKRP